MADEEIRDGGAVKKRNARAPRIYKEAAAAARWCGCVGAGARRGPSIPCWPPAHPGPILRAGAAAVPPPSRLGEECEFIAGSLRNGRWTTSFVDVAEDSCVTLDRATAATSEALGVELNRRPAVSEQRGAELDPLPARERRGAEPGGREPL